MKLPILTASLLFLSGAQVLCANGSPAGEAHSIVQGLGARGGLPPMHELARLDNAGDPVCAALGAELRGVRPEEATRVVSFFPQSTNASVHAALVLALSAANAEVAGACLDALTTLSFDQIVALRGAVTKLDATHLRALQDQGVWPRLIDGEIFDLCSLESKLLNTPEMRHRQFAFALLVDLYSGAGSLRAITDRVVHHMVGERPLAHEDVSEEPIPDEQTPDTESEAIDDAEMRRRIDDERMRERRRGAQIVFSTLLIIDHVAFFDLGGSYDKRVERAKAFWDSYRDNIGEATTWRAHLLWAQANASSVESRLTALMAMDELCGGVTVEGERSPDAPKDESLPQVPVFTRETPLARIENFKKLDTRTGQRPRIRAIKKAFQDKFAVASD